VEEGVRIDKEKLKKSLRNFVEALEKVEVVINEAVKSPLSKEEMEAILDAYDEKVGIPKYIRKQIMDAVKEETVWGFSQAVSYVRTHGQIKGKAEDRELRSMTRTLDNIAAEVLFLTPAISSIREKVGKITKQVLIPVEAQE